jgi:hypothetical protein
MYDIKIVGAREPEKTKKKQDEVIGSGRNRNEPYTVASENSSGIKPLHLPDVFE